MTSHTGRAAVLTTAEELAADLTASRPPIVLDVRWSLGGPPGHGEYRGGHIPSAVYVDLDAELAGHGGDPTNGRHPLPDPVDLEAAIRRWGIHDDDRVVAYDASGNLAAARAWWLLRWAGLADVRLLDGGLAAWTAAGGPLSTDEVTPTPGDASVRPGSLPVLSVEEAASWPRHGVLLDARAPERYRGESEPIDPKAGHIPGAHNAPTGDNLTADGHFRPTEELRDRFAALGATERPVAAYCGSGVTAAHQLAALAIAGVEGRLYPGSWSQWSNLDRPVATGAEPGRGAGRTGR
ncbi:MAG: sulfurtransferase [Nocardioides sp.]|uniref:sulfurtransferase n=1 Tax=Nocardioides sp. TaxID=35761 RepID=UPI0039E7207C